MNGNNPFQPPLPDQYRPLINHQLAQRNLMESLQGGFNLQPEDVRGLQQAVLRYPGALQNVFQENVQAAARAAAQRAEQAAGTIETPAYERGSEPLAEAWKIAGSPKQAVGRAAIGSPAPIAEMITGAMPIAPPIGALQASIDLVGPETMRFLQAVFHLMSRR